MSSFNKVNFGQRASKAIQRDLVFESVQQVTHLLNLKTINYVGFGSLWFTDFIAADRLFDIKHMISLERDAIGAIRAAYNKPSDKIEVLAQSSSQFLQSSTWDAMSSESVPSVVWFDYDEAISEDIVSDISRLAADVPINSSILVTINVDDEFERSGQRNDLRNLPRNSRDRLSLAVTAALSNSPDLAAFQFCDCVYYDSVTMLTLGFSIVSSTDRTKLQRAEQWAGMLGYRIKAPILTMKEIAALRRRSDSGFAIDHGTLRDLGFDLDDEQIQTYNLHMRG